MYVPHVARAFSLAPNYIIEVITVVCMMDMTAASGNVCKLELETSDAF